MPELPEVQTVVNELNKKLKGLKITKVIVNKPKLIAIGPETLPNIREGNRRTAERFISIIKNQKINSVKRRAKLLIFDLTGPWSLLVHLKMTGQFIYEDENLKNKTGGKYRVLNKEKAPLVKLPGKFTHVIFYFSNKSVLYFNDVRQFGYMKLVHDDEINLVKELKEYGPEPLSKAFKVENFIKALARRKNTSIKQLLLDPKVVAGIGNIYSDEILFHSKVKPQRKALTLSNSEVKRIFKYIPLVLKEGIKYKGSSVGDFIRTDGRFGSMGKHHFVYGRKGKPCKRCATILESIKLSGRTSSFCPNCQK